VEIHAPGRLKGNIITPALQVDRGVIFEGGCQMENVEEKLRQRSAVLAATTTTPAPKGAPEPAVKAVPPAQP
jgi:cytoskeletal protein CcmA (bactofilin family)